MSHPVSTQEYECEGKNHFGDPCSEADPCEECCEHGDQDEYVCLDCGKEMIEDRMATAYDRAKAADDFAREIEPRGCRCGNNGGGDCEYCLARKHGMLELGLCDESEFAPEGELT